MSENKKNSKEEGGGFGLGSALLVGAGAAVCGFLAGKIVQNYQEQSSSSGSSRPQPPPSDIQRSCSRSDWENKPDKLEARKKHRDTARDQNLPDEMKCIVCIDNPREVCLIPCGHVCLCEDCCEKIKTKCPMCQQPIKSTKAIYM